MSFSLSSDYSYDEKQHHGTSDAVKSELLKLFEKFVVIYGDSYMPVDYAAIVQAFVVSRKPALMTVFENEGRWDASNLWFACGEIRHYSKKLPTSEMRHIDYGIAVLSASVFGSFPDDAM